jgi:hypothetical protein
MKRNVRTYTIVFVVVVGGWHRNEFETSCCLLLGGLAVMLLLR